MVTMRRAGEVPERPDRFEALYQSSYQEIFAFVLRRMDAGQDAVADVVAEVFVVALRRRDAIPESPQDRLWLYGVARRVLLEQRRRSARRMRLHSQLRAQAALRGPNASPADPLQLRLREAVERLRPTDREALRLVAWDGLSHAEAAEVLGCSVNAVALRIYRAKARLRDDLSSLRSPPSPGGPKHSIALQEKGARYEH